MRGVEEISVQIGTQPVRAAGIAPLTDVTARGRFADWTTDSEAKADLARSALVGAGCA